MSAIEHGADIGAKGGIHFALLGKVGGPGRPIDAWALLRAVPTSTTAPARAPCNEPPCEALWCTLGLLGRHEIEVDPPFRRVLQGGGPHPEAGGLLITSTDYFDGPIDTKGQQAFGMPIHIFTRSEILSAVEVAGRFGLRLTGPIDLDCIEKAVCWDRYDLEYASVVFTLRHEAPSGLDDSSRGVS